MQSTTALYLPEPTLWGRIEGILADREMPLFRYALTVALMTAIPVALMVALAAASGHLQFTVENLIQPWPVTGYPFAGFVLGFLESVLLAPFLETALVLVSVWLLRGLRASEAMIPVLAAIFWALVHVKAGGTWLQLIQMWPFFFFTLVLIKQEKFSLGGAWLRSSLVHTMHNSIGMAWGLPLALLG